MPFAFFFFLRNSNEQFFFLYFVVECRAHFRHNKPRKHHTWCKVSFILFRTERQATSRQEKQRWKKSRKKIHILHRVSMSSHAAPSSYVTLWKKNYYYFSYTFFLYTLCGWRAYIIFFCFYFGFSLSIFSFVEANASCNENILRAFGQANALFVYNQIRCCCFFACLSLLFNVASTSNNLNAYFIFALGTWKQHRRRRQWQSVDDD